MNEHVVPPPAAEPAPASAGAVDIAMATAAEAGADSPAWRLLEEQRRLVREQVALARNERFRNRIKAARDLSIAAGTALLIFAAIWMVWDASRAQGVVVEPFAVPPDLAAQGLTGQAAAARMLDQVAEMEPSAQDLALAGLGVRGSEAGAARIEIPQSGVSLDEASRWLRRTLGDEVPVTGEVRREGDRLRVTVRVSGQPADVVTGPAAQIDRALEIAAERMYARIEPLRYSRYLYDRAEDRWTDARLEWIRRGGPPSPEAVAAARRLRTEGYSRAIDVSRRVALGGGPNQAWGYAFWGSQLWGRDSRAAESVRLLELARRLDPELAYAPASLTSIHNISGEPQLEREAAKTAHDLFGRRRADVEAGHVASARLQMLASMARTEAAFGDGARRYCGAADRGEYLPVTRRGCAVFLARNHDAQGAEAAWALLDRRDQGVVNFIVLQVWLAQARGDSRAELAAHERWAEAAIAEGRERRLPTAVWPSMAVALARAGRQDEAEALAARTAGCYECLRARGRVAAMGRNWSEAERWLGAAARRGPEVPFAYQDLAEARFARGDLEGALQALRDAREHGPRWADPLKLEGEVLARQGKHREAVRRYGEAAERAPRWGALHLAWGRSLEALGRQEQARAKYAQAARMDLSAADRAELSRRHRTAA